MKKEVKVGSIGLGHIAQDAHIPAIMCIEGAKIVALCDSNKETLQKVGLLYNIDQLYTDPVEMAEKNDCDCVFVLTQPASTHLSITKVMFKNGKDVMCEKPMATKLSEAKEMMEEAEKTSQILMIGFNRRFMPICEKAKEVFKDRELDICKVSVNLGKPMIGALLESPHQLDLLRYFGGDVSSIVNCCSKFDSTAREESITALIKFESGSAGMLILNNLSGGKSGNVELHGGGYSVIVDMLSQTTRIMNNKNAGLFSPQEWTEYKPPKWAGFYRANGFMQQDEHFIDCVRNRKQPLFSALDAYRSHELLNEIYKVSGLPTLE